MTNQPKYQNLRKQKITNKKIRNQRKISIKNQRNTKKIKRSRKGKVKRARKIKKNKNKNKSKMILTALTWTMRIWKEEMLLKEDH